MQAPASTRARSSAASPPRQATDETASASGCARSSAQPVALGLIVCPLGVRQELIRDAAMLGIRLVFIRSASEIVDG